MLASWQYTKAAVAAVPAPVRGDRREARPQIGGKAVQKKTRVVAGGVAVYKGHPGPPPQLVLFLLPFPFLIRGPEKQ